MSKASRQNDSPAALRDYERKRDRQKTPEPFAGTARTRRSPVNGGIFVVQQHAARRMHWDLRLEIGGALASWAVPRGPSLDLKERRLAVQTEDHPLEYATFEGIIPQGNYGAGAMIVWDRGTFVTVDGTATDDDRANGKLDLQFFGHKLRGRWGLVRTKQGGGKDWLLLKKPPASAAAGELVVDYPQSILSGLTIDQLWNRCDRTEILAASAVEFGAIEATVDASKLRPMLADSIVDPFDDDEWIFELKHDGFRCLASKNETRAVLYSRTGLDLSLVFPEVTASIARLPCSDFVLDGEIVALDERGASSFERLQQRLQFDPAAAAEAALATPTVLFCFDLIAIAGRDLRSVPLIERKRLLRQLLPQRGIARYADDIEKQGRAFFDQVRAMDLEGIVAKRKSSPYTPGRRSRHWLKLKVERSGDFVVVGHQRGRGSRQALGSLLLAARDRDRGLRYVGSVGSGLGGEVIRELLQRRSAISRTDLECAALPKSLSRITLVRPECVVSVRFREWTSSGILRQPVFLSIRTDKLASECDPVPSTEEVPAERGAPAAPAIQSVAPPDQSSDDLRLRIVNRDKVFWPEDGYTKNDLLGYYQAIWPWLEPYLRDRPVVLTRYPDGIAGKSFFQKNAPDFTPVWVPRYRHDDTDYFICNRVEALLYVINSGCIPLHVWSSRQVDPDRPDWLILDLDPKTAPFRAVIEVARHSHRLLEEIGLPNFVKTSGQDGLHILVPLNGSLTHSESKMCAELLARTIASECSTVATTSRAIGGRGNRVYIDALQNGAGKTIASIFSVRARRGAPVSTPLEWSEVGEGLDPRAFTIATLPKRIDEHGDPMQPLWKAKDDILGALERLAQRVR